MPRFLVCFFAHFFGPSARRPCGEHVVLVPEVSGVGLSLLTFPRTFVGGVVPLRLQSAFVAAKAGVINLTKSMALELGPRG